MKFKLSIFIAFVALIVTSVAKPAEIFGQDAVFLHAVFVLVLLSASGGAFYLAYNTRKIDLQRQVSIWAAGMAAVTVVATNMDLLTGTLSAPQPIAEVVKISAPETTGAPIQKPKRANKYDLDLPTVDPVEIFEETKEEKQFALDNPEIHDETPE